ncbi:spore germination protein, partial [Lysinibacillus sp. GbtcB16]|uniref:spore germination protein n=1 Tax=Lysinibacillus sp. GbtcB16 TaxID=2824761 RepID=UPI001C2F307C
ITVAEMQETDSLDTCIRDILLGNTVLLIDGITGCMVLKTSHVEGRSITEPSSESLVRGSREGFVENISTNVSLIRQRVKDPS